VDEVISCEQIRQSFHSSPPDAAILDYSLPDGTALELLPQLRQTFPGVPIIILTGNGTIALAVQAIKEGAEHFLTKPIQMAAIGVVLQRALQNQRNHQKHLAEKVLEKRNNTDPFLGNSAAIRNLAIEAGKISASHCPVLIYGETGTGKGVLARWLHRNGPRAEDAFVDMNCAGLGRELLESELFGHEAGAFTGAVQRKLGLLEVAQRGTVFLDEIGDMDLQIQPKLLKVLEEKKLRRLGDVHERRLDIRLIAASHQNLAQMVRENKFRSDLYFRVSTVSLRMPALGERREDIPVLAEHLLRKAAAELGKPDICLSEEATEKLTAYAWPGNVRELKNVLERAVLLASQDSIQPRDLHLEFAVRPAAKNEDSQLTLKEMQQLHIARALDAEHGNILRTADRLGITRSSLYSKIKTFGLHPQRQQTTSAFEATLLGDCGR
jgi:DNA-binding NtrC family response regulator